jgi:hypothetical protein
VVRPLWVRSSCSDPSTTRLPDSDDVLNAGGIDPLEVEHRALLEVQFDDGSVVVLTEPLV